MDVRRPHRLDRRNFNRWEWEPLILLSVLAATAITIGIAVLYIVLLILSAVTIAGVFRRQALRATPPRPK